MAVDPKQILIDRPDVLSEYNRIFPTVDWNSPWAGKHGFSQTGGPDEFATWWYNTYGKDQGYGAPPAAPPPVATDPTPAPTTPTTDPLQSLIEKLLGGFTDSAAKEQQLEAARGQARDSVYSGLGTSGSKFSPDLLDDTINSILGTKASAAQEQLDRGKARGMYNDVGYQAGLASLNTNKEAAHSRLENSAEGILAGYRSKYDDVRNEALGAASTFSGVGQFSLDPFLNEANDLVTRAKAAAPGAFLDAIGSDPLFDLSAIRSDAGTAQGALNLRDTSLVDALAKRKKVDALGRGLGSQGAF